MNRLCVFVLYALMLNFQFLDFNCSYNHYFIPNRPVSRRMLEKCPLLAAVRYTLPPHEWLPGKNSDWSHAIVSNKFLMTPDAHLETYSKVGILLIRFKPFQYFSNISFH